MGTGRKSDAVIDAMLGTGLNTEVKGLYKNIIEKINGLNVPVLAVDVPSGLDSTTGLPLGAAIKATATATFGFLKIGHLIEPGSELVGQVEVIDIGIPPGLVQSAGIQRYWLTEEFLSSWIEPRRPETHKGQAGHVCVLSGSLGKTGAATLVCLGAARAGAGLVTLFVPESLNPIMEVKLTEAMTLPIAETPERTPASAALDQILDFLKGKQALAIGPGISTNEDTAALVKELLRNAPCPMVLDADAITAVSEDPGHPAQGKSPARAHAASRRDGPALSLHRTGCPAQPNRIRIKVQQRIRRSAPAQRASDYYCGAGWKACDKQHGKSRNGQRRNGRHSDRDHFRSARPGIRCFSGRLPRGLCPRGRMRPNIPGGREPRAYGNRHAGRSPRRIGLSRRP